MDPQGEGGSGRDISRFFIRLSVSLAESQEHVGWSEGLPRGRGGGGSHGISIHKEGR